MYTSKPFCINVIIVFFLKLYRYQHVLADKIIFSFFILTFQVPMTPK